MPRTDLENSSDRKAYIITGPTSGIGLGDGVRVGASRNADPRRPRPQQAERAGEGPRGAGGGRRAVSVVCDLSDLDSVRASGTRDHRVGTSARGPAQQRRHPVGRGEAAKSAQGIDMSFATNHLGPFVLTEALLPHLQDGARVVFVYASAVEDPEARGRRRVAGFRGARYISAEASARGEWLAGGSTVRGFDAYATTKQAALATALELAREHPRLRIYAVEPGFNPGTGLARGANVLMGFLMKYILPMLAPFMKNWSTPKRAGRVATEVLINASGQTGIYYDEGGHPMLGSPLVRDPKFQDRVVAETRALLATVPAQLANNGQQQREVLR